MAGIEFCHHLLGSNQIIGIRLPSVYSGCGQADGFQAGSEKTVATEQHHENRRSDYYPSFSDGHGRRWCLAAPLRGGGEQTEPNECQ